MQKTNCYYPEGMCYSQPIDPSRALSEGTIHQAVAVRCNARHDLTIDLGDQLGFMPREECALGIDSGKTREIAILSRVGRPVCFKVLRIEDDRVILSRRAAQREALDYFMTLTPGDVIPARVTHLEPFGAFVDIGCGVISLIGIENISVSRISHPSERFAVGQDIYAAVLYQEPELERLTLTHRELLGTWAQNAALFSPGETVCGIVRSVEDYGVFIELAPNLSGLAEKRFHVMAGQQVSCFIKSILPERMKIKLNLIEPLDQPPILPTPLSYFIDHGHLDRWMYSPECCTQRMIGTDFTVYQE